MYFFSYWISSVIKIFQSLSFAALNKNESSLMAIESVSFPNDRHDTNDSIWSSDEAMPLAINPATGFVMIYGSTIGVEVQGNPYGLDLHDTTMSSAFDHLSMHHDSLDIGMSSMELTFQSDF
jgi:hypothetical protein